MTWHSGCIQELSELTFHALNQTITDEQFQRLEHLLVTHPLARAYYLEILCVCVGLNEKEGIASLQAEGRAVEEFDMALWQALAREEKQARPAASHQSMSEQRPLVTNVKAYKQTLKAPRRVSRAALWTATLSLAAMLLMAVYVVLAPPPSMAVATIVDAIDAQGPGAQSVRVGLRVATSREPIQLTRGLIRLQTDAGVELCLEGPAKFRFASGTELVMTYGRVFARVGPEGRDFTVTTPSSRVIDLGTQFGVQADAGGQTELHVFEGSALILAGEPDKSRTPELVEAGQARRVDYQSRQIEAIPIVQELFVRSIDSEKQLVWRGQSLSLADMVGGGNGLGTGRPETGISPLTGRRGGYVSRDREAPNEFVQTPLERYIDGVFVPNGRGIQTISSLGHIFEACPETGGLFYSEMIYGAGRYLDDFALGAAAGTLGGRVYGTPETPSLFLHANLGITFDLKAIRNDYPDFATCRFTAEAGLSTAAPETGNADIWVLVDGQVRFVEKGIREKGRAFSIDIQLKPTDRFLTLVSTDGGDDNSVFRTSIASDWCVFVWPQLISAGSRSHE